jgi:hypothetical protein
MSDQIERKISRSVEQLQMTGQAPDGDRIVYRASTQRHR